MTQIQAMHYILTANLGACLCGIFWKLKVRTGIAAFRHIMEGVCHTNQDKVVSAVQEGYGFTRLTPGWPLQLRVA